jgi:hypothetical protein
MKPGVPPCVAGVVLFTLLVLVLSGPWGASEGRVGWIIPGSVAAGAGTAASPGCETLGTCHTSPSAPMRLSPSPSRRTRVPDSGDAVEVSNWTLGGVSSFQAKPDLTVLDTWTVPSTFCRYAVVDIHSMIKNIGTATVSDSFYFDMWFDGDNIGFAHIESLAAGGTLELILEDYAWPGDTLSHVITAMADTDHEIDEELETNNIHLEYVAAELCTTCTFVTLPLAAGWNWFSLNVDDPDMSLDNVLASLDANGVYIKSQTVFAEYVPAWNGWFGTLTELSCHETYMIKMGNQDTLDFCGFPYDVSTPLSLPPGWSWVSYLPQDTMTVDDALISIGANGEYIKNQTAFAEYVPAWNGWFGTLVDMRPADGYKIRMASADTLVYPNSMEEMAWSGWQRSSGDLLGSASDGWEVDPHGFEANGCLIVEVRMGDKACTGPGDRLGAFWRGECRGSAPALVNPDGRHVFYLTVYGRGGAEEILDFRYFEAAGGLTHDIRERVEFVSDVTEGSSLCPLIMRVADVPGREATVSTAPFSLENSPDPFTGNTTVRFRLGSPGVVTLGIYDVRGAKVATLWEDYLASGTYTLVWNAGSDSGQPVPGGIYFCRLGCHGALLTEKIVLIR